MQEPYRFYNINLENIVYTKIKSNTTKKIIYIKYNDNNKLNNLVFQTPTLYNVNSAIIHNKYYELDVPLKGKNDRKVYKFSSFINDLDNKIIYDAKIHASEWFNNITNNNTIRYQKIIRTSSDCKNGIIRNKIIDTPEFQTILQINNTTNIKPCNVPINSTVKMLLECYAIWINNNGFGLFIRPIIISFIPIEIPNYNYSFIEDSEHDDNDIEIEDIDDVIDSKYKTNVFIKNNLNNLDIDTENNFDSTTSSDESEVDFFA